MHHRLNQLSQRSDEFHDLRRHGEVTVDKNAGRNQLQVDVMKKLYYYLYVDIIEPIYLSIYLAIDLSISILYTYLNQ